MLRITIVEDNPADLAALQDCLHRYEQEQGEHFTVRSYANPAQFLDEYRLDSDLIFMDIELPVFNGLKVSQRLREIDPVVTLVFVTNMEQYAVKGYEVDALDFVVKPINYFRFSSVMRRALRNIGHRAEKEVALQTADTIIRLRISQIYYIEIRDHLLLYHTEQGVFSAWGKLSELEAELEAYNFARCSNSHLVNLFHVTSVTKNDVNIRGQALPISQRRRKAFSTRVMDYLSRKT